MPENLKVLESAAKALSKVGGFCSIMPESRWAVATIIRTTGKKTRVRTGLLLIGAATSEPRVEPDARPLYRDRKSRRSLH